MENEPSAKITASIHRVLGCEADAIRTVANSQLEHADLIVRALLSTTGNVVCSGVGKAGIIARKAAATLASTGTRSFWLDPINALHGDLGMVGEQDIALLLSNSGSSTEILALADALGTLNTARIAITKDSETPLARRCEFTFAYGAHEEACPMNLAPTTSTTVMLALTDALAVALQEWRGFTREDYARYHPAGALGRRLSCVCSHMRTGERVAKVTNAANIGDAMIAVSQARSGICVVVDDTQRLLGVYTDGDFRRDWQHGVNPAATLIADKMTSPCKRIEQTAQVEQALQIMHDSHINALPVVDEQNKLAGVLDIQDIV